MKKKIIGVVSLLALVVILATALVACNPTSGTVSAAATPLPR